MLPLITHVEITPAPVDDSQVTAQIHTALQAKDLLPNRHMVDTGYLDAELLATSPRDYGVELWGPTRQEVRWLADEPRARTRRSPLLKLQQAA